MLIHSNSLNEIFLVISKDFRFLSKSFILQIDTNEKRHLFPDAFSMNYKIVSLLDRSINFINNTVTCSANIVVMQIEFTG